MIHPWVGTIKKLWTHPRRRNWTIPRMCSISSLSESLRPGVSMITHLVTFVTQKPESSLVLSARLWLSMLSLSNLFLSERRLTSLEGSTVCWSRLNISWLKFCLVAGFSRLHSSQMVSDHMRVKLTAYVTHVLATDNSISLCPESNRMIGYLTWISWCTSCWCLVGCAFCYLLSVTDNYPPGTP